MANLQKRSFILLVLLKWIELLYQIAVFSLIIIAGFQWLASANSYADVENGGKWCLPLAIVYSLTVWYNNLFFNLRFKLCIVDRCECPRARKCSYSCKKLNDDSCNFIGTVKAILIMAMAVGIVYSTPGELDEYRSWVWFVALQYPGFIALRLVAFPVWTVFTACCDLSETYDAEDTMDWSIISFNFVEWRLDSERVQVSRANQAMREAQ